MNMADKYAALDLGTPFYFTVVEMKGRKFRDENVADWVAWYRYKKSQIVYVARKCSFKIKLKGTVFR